MWEQAAEGAEGEKEDIAVDPGKLLLVMITEKKICNNCNIVLEARAPGGGARYEGQSRDGDGGDGGVEHCIL